MEDDILDLLYNFGLDKQFQRLADGADADKEKEKVVEEPIVVQKEKPNTSARY